jgi:hypothetical protein
MSENERDIGLQFLLQAAHGVSHEKAHALAQLFESHQDEAAAQLLASIAIANFGTEQALINFLFTLYKQSALGELLKKSGFSPEERGTVLNLLHDVIQEDQWESFWKIASFAHLQRMGTAVMTKVGLRRSQSREIFGVSSDSHE